MNLIGDPWVPVLALDGSPRLVSLRELFEQADQIRDLNAPPPQRISLMRLLTCIAQAALDGPGGEREWSACRSRIAPASLQYLESRLDRFELFGERPFLQVPSLKRTRNAVCDKLDFGLSAGNNAALHDQAAVPSGRPHEPGWLALMLLTYQCFSPSGRIGANTWGGVDMEPKSEHAPCIEGSPLHVIVRGDNLLQTLHLNLLTREQVADLPSAAWGQPAWDNPPTGPGIQQKHSTSYLARLVPMPRAILLDSGAPAFTLASGVAYAKLPAYREPTATTVKRGKGPKERLCYLHINLERHPWRELDAVLSVAGKEDCGPLALRHLAVLPDGQATVDVWTGGLVADKGKILDMAEWEFSIPREFLEETSLNLYHAGVEIAEGGAGKLRGAIGKYCVSLEPGDDKGKKPKKRKNDSPGDTLIPRAQSLFWGRMDQAYPQLIEATGSDNGLGDWHNLVQRTVNDAYAQTCPHETPRQIQAFALAQRHLRLKE
jgi:CRISPR system Cascade subunit CasA